MPIPITCVDNFYRYPDRIREYALSLDYDFTGNNFPGKRTQSLHLINEQFFHEFCNKLFSLFYDPILDKNLKWNCDTGFQKIYPNHPDYNNPLNSGWYHKDIPFVFAGVIYLNKDTNPNSGTTIGRLKEGDSLEENSWDARDRFYSSEPDISIEEYTKEINDHNSMFEVTLPVSNVYNRLIVYNGDVWHKESNFCVNEEFRLTQTFFVSSFDASSAPLDRIQNFNL